MLFSDGASTAKAKVISSVAFRQIPQICWWAFLFFSANPATTSQCIYIAEGYFALPSGHLSAGLKSPIIREHLVKNPMRLHLTEAMTRLGNTDVKNLPRDDVTRVFWVGITISLSLHFWSHNNNNYVYNLKLKFFDKQYSAVHCSDLSC